jgi:hypothetical protein
MKSGMKDFPPPKAKAKHPEKPKSPPKTFGFHASAKDKERQQYGKKGKPAAQNVMPSFYDKECGVKPSDYTDRPRYVVDCRLSHMRIEGCYKYKRLEDCVDDISLLHWPRDAH